MNKFVLIGLMTFFVTSTATAQTVQDALRYSRLQAGGTARSVSTGGALSAFGGDFGTLSINPAGIATYRKSTLVFTPLLQFTNTLSTFDVNTYKEGKTNFAVGNVGLVISTSQEDSDWKTVNFAIGMNRQTDYNQRIFFDGTTPNTIAARWVALANGYYPSDLYEFEEKLAYDANVIFNLPSPNGSIDSTVYHSDLGENDLVRKQQTALRKGTINDFIFSFGGNYQDRLYVGLTIGLPLLSFEEQKSYRELDELNLDQYFNEMTYNENLTTTGIGFNAKLGVILRVNQRIRLGAAIHSPTFFSLSDNYFTDLTSNLTFNNQVYETTAESPVSNYSYRLNTPWRAVGSVGFMFGKSGFLSADVEYVDYAVAQFDFGSSVNPDDQLFEQNLNKNVQQTLTQSLNVRLGAEIRFGVLALRGGYALYTTPYADVLSRANEVYQTYSFGLGLREKRFFLDLGYTTTNFDETYRPFTMPNSAVQAEVANDVTTNRLIASIGFRF